MGGHILLITNVDVTYRKLLLEAEGYKVQQVVGRSAADKIEPGVYQLALVSTEIGVEASLRLCRRLKEADEEICVAIMPQRTDLFPSDSCIDAILHEQYSPAEFLSQIRQLIDSGPRTSRGHSAG